MAGFEDLITLGIVSIEVHWRLWEVIWKLWGFILYVIRLVVLFILNEALNTIF